MMTRALWLALVKQNASTVHGGHNRSCLTQPFAADSHNAANSGENHSLVMELDNG